MSIVPFYLIIMFRAHLFYQSYPAENANDSGFFACMFAATVMQNKDAATVASITQQAVTEHRLDYAKKLKR